MFEGVGKGRDRGELLKTADFSDQGEVKQQKRETIGFEARVSASEISKKQTGKGEGVYV